MIPPLRPQSPVSTSSYLTEFQQLIQEKSENFVDRVFAFAAINEFLHRCDRKALPQGNRGYFTLIGALGSGKSAILAKYVKLWHLNTEEVIASFTRDLDFGQKKICSRVLNAN